MLLDTLPGGGGDGDPSQDKLEQIIEEQSAMQKLVQQLKDTREGEPCEQCTTCCA